MSVVASDFTHLCLPLSRQRRVDNSAELAAEARYAFAAGLAVGEAGLQLARQALLIAAEDDAIGEHAAAGWFVCSAKQQQQSAGSA